MRYRVILLILVAVGFSCTQMGGCHENTLKITVVNNYFTDVTIEIRHDGGGYCTIAIVGSGDIEDVYVNKDYRGNKLRARDGDTLISSIRARDDVIFIVE